MEKIINIDFHAHILPGVDHGCRDANMALSQLKRAAAAGVDIVVATPHFYPHAETVDHFLHRRGSAVDELRKIMSVETDLPRVLVGAEVLACPGLERMDRLLDLCLENTNVLLLEMPFADRWEQDLVDSAVKMHESGIRVILAHAERYRISQVHRLTEKGIPVQLNVDALWGGRFFFRAQKYLKEKCVTALGSDIHGLSDAYDTFRKIMKYYGTAARNVQEKTLDILQKGG